MSTKSVMPCHFRRCCPGPEWRAALLSRDFARAERNFSRAPILNDVWAQRQSPDLSRGQACREPQRLRSPASRDCAKLPEPSDQAKRAGTTMHTLKIVDVTITSIIERDGPWRKPEDMFPTYDAAVGRRHLAEMDPVVFDGASGRMVITYQTFLVRTPK